MVPFTEMENIRGRPSLGMVLDMLSLRCFLNIQVEMSNWQVEFRKKVRIGDTNLRIICERWCLKPWDWVRSPKV